MIKVTDVVLDLIQTDELALESLRAGLLNLSAFADKIHQRVENATKKPVQKGTIVVALSRITKHLPSAASLIPDISLTNIGIKSSLTVITYKKTVDTQRKISVLNPFLLPINDLFSVTEGPEEITVICSDRSKEIVLKNIGSKPEAEINGLVAVSVAFDKKYLDTPNVIYTLLSTLATKRINIYELVSTYTELSFIIKKEDMETAIKAMNVYFNK